MGIIDFFHEQLQNNLHTRIFGMVWCILIIWECEVRVSASKVDQNKNKNPKVQFKKNNF
jgi:G:T-mismatch repair DNA endonuclease (very short patch repair protein)